MESLLFCLLFLPLRTVKLPEELQRRVGVWAFASLRSDRGCVLGQCCVCVPSLQDGLSPSWLSPFLPSACCLPSTSTHVFGVPATLDEVVPFCRNPLYPLLCELCTLCFNVKLALSPAISLAICAQLLTAWKNLNADLYLLMIELFMALWRSACCFWSWRELTEKTGTSCLPFWNLKHESFFSFNVSLEVIFKSYRKALIVQHTSWKGFLRISVILRSCGVCVFVFFFPQKNLIQCCF